MHLAGMDHSKPWPLGWEHPGGLASPSTLACTDDVGFPAKRREQGRTQCHDSFILDSVGLHYT